MMYKMKKDKRDSKMYGGGMKRKTAMGGGGMYGRKSAKHGGPHNDMDRINMFKGGAMEVAKPN